ncbi:MAG: hypothetical protein ACQESD_06000 [Thermoplasmatota archaeon]
MKIKKFFVLGVVSLLLLSLSINFLPSVSAQEGSPVDGAGDQQPPDMDNDEKGPHKGIDQDRIDFEKRKLNVDRSNKNAVVTTSWSDESTNDEVKMNFDFGEGSPSMDMEYNVDKDSKQLRLSFQLIFKKLFEFHDNNGNGRYDEGEEIISEYVFKGSDFGDIQFDEDHEIYDFQTNTKDSVFKIRVRGGGEFMEVDGNTLNPYESKIDFEINYGFQSEDSMLGLKMEIKGDHPKEMAKHTFDEENRWADNESWLRLRHDNYSGFFSWQNRAQSGGKDIPVNATFISESAVDDIGSVVPVNDVLYLSYPQSSQIVHDPKIGVVGESSLSYTVTDEIDFMYLTTILAITMITAALVFSAGIYIRKRD